VGVGFHGPLISDEIFRGSFFQHISRERCRMSTLGGSSPLPCCQLVPLPIIGSYRTLHFFPPPMGGPTCNFSKRGPPKPLSRFPKLHCVIFSFSPVLAWFFQPTWAFPSPPSLNNSIFNGDAFLFSTTPLSFAPPPSLFVRLLRTLFRFFSLLLNGRRHPKHPPNSPRTGLHLSGPLFFLNFIPPV